MRTIPFKALLLGSLLTLPLASQAVVIDFDSETMTFPFNGPVVEDGFSYQGAGGSLALIDFDGNPGSYMSAVADGVLTITRLGGGLFTFDAADVVAIGSDAGATLGFAGYLGGALAASEPFATTTLWTTLPSSALAGSTIDELRITIAATSAQSRTGVDNIVLTAVTGTPGQPGADVPEPTSLALLGLGI
ncbi:MAG: hypothetical protein RLW62_09635, partial [Gammaproteobacteria bacterium]